MGDWGGVTAYLRPGPHAHAVAKGQRVTIPMAVQPDKNRPDDRNRPDRNRPDRNRPAAAGGGAAAEADAEKELARRLMLLRREIAPGKETHAYGERGAKAIAAALPMSRRQLAFVEGIGVGKADKWGDRVSRRRG
eukprot:scaffold16994_cov84-Isochrysis_galbana.AAC.1